jgi:hypothetical protein
MTSHAHHPALDPHDPSHTHHHEGHHSGRLADRLATPGGAYALAWGIWFVYLVTPMFLFLATLLYLLAKPTTMAITPGQTWFLAMMLMLAPGVPLVFYIRGKLFFYGYLNGRSVTPRQYIYGMVMVWTWIELIGLLSLAGCIVSGSLAPCVIPALMAFIVFLTQWPNATALANHTGHLDDPSLFHHPR